MGIEGYNSTPASNTTLASTSLAEGQTRQKDLNDQVRQILADVKDGVVARFSLVTDVQALDNSASTGLISHTIAVDQVGIFYYDSADSSTADDGATVLVTVSGERYKLFSNSEDYIPNVKASSELTVASGAITLTQHCHTVDTQADAAADDLTDIVWWSGVKAGDTCELRAENTSRVVTVKSATGAGKINTFNNEDFPLDDETKVAKLYWDGTQSHLIVSTAPAATELITFKGAADGSDGVNNWTLLKALAADTDNAGKLIYFPYTGTGEYRFNIGDEAAVDVGGGTLFAGLKTAPGVTIALDVPTQSSSRRVFSNLGGTKWPCKVFVNTAAVNAQIYFIGLMSGDINLDYMDFNGNMAWDGVTESIDGNNGAGAQLLIVEPSAPSSIVDVTMRHAILQNYKRFCLKASIEVATKRFVCEYNILSTCNITYMGLNSPEAANDDHSYSHNKLFGWADGTVTNNDWGRGITGSRLGNTLIEDNIFHNNFKEAIHIEEAGRDVIIRGNKSGGNFHGDGIELIDNDVGGSDESHGTDYFFKRCIVTDNIFVAADRVDQGNGASFTGIYLVGGSSDASGAGALETLIANNHIEGFDLGIVDRHYDHTSEFHYTSEAVNNRIKDCRVAMRTTRPTTLWHDNTLIDNDNNLTALTGGAFGFNRFIFSDWSTAPKLIDADTENVVTGLTIGMNGFELVSYLTLPLVNNGATGLFKLMDVDEIELFEASIIPFSMTDIPNSGDVTRVGCFRDVVLDGNTLTGGWPTRAPSSDSRGDSWDPNLQFNAGSPDELNLEITPTAFGETSTVGFTMDARTSVLVFVN